MYEFNLSNFAKNYNLTTKTKRFRSKNKKFISLVSLPIYKKGFFASHFTCFVCRKTQISYLRTMPGFEFCISFPMFCIPLFFAKKGLRECKAWLINKNGIRKTRASYFLPTASFFSFAFTPCFTSPSKARPFTPYLKSFYPFFTPSLKGLLCMRSNPFGAGPASAPFRLLCMRSNPGVELATNAKQPVPYLKGVRRGFYPLLPPLWGGKEREGVRSMALLRMLCVASNPKGRGSNPFPFGAGLQSRGSEEWSKKQEEGLVKRANKNQFLFKKKRWRVIRNCLTSAVYTSNSQKQSILEKESDLSAHDFDRFWNQCFDKGQLKAFVFWFLKNYGESQTVRLLEKLKDTGFKYATKAGVSISIDDLKIPKSKSILIGEAETQTFNAIIEYRRGNITGVERFQKLIDTWHRTSELLKREVINHFEETDILNPVYMMAFSGARGNVSQVRQLVGMRGLMADPQGQIIDFPIRSNFREGLTLTEYIISSYGARKGIVDTALRTANAGYLTRRLVDVAQHVIVAQFDCGTKRGIFVTSLKEGNKTLYSLQQRLIGRVLAKDLNFNENIIAYRNEEISEKLSSQISLIFQRVLIRSPLTCETKKLVCQLCYGWSLAQGSLVSIGEAVGIIAAQSIGEPGTQLTMRTFHTGGVFSGDVTDQIIAPFDGFIEYLEPIAGSLIRTPEGRLAFLTKNEGSFVLNPGDPYFENLKEDKKNNNDNTVFLISKAAANLKNSNLPRIVCNYPKTQKVYKIPAYTVLFVKNREKFFEKQVVAQISTFSKQKKQRDDEEQDIKAEMEGEVYHGHIELLEQMNDYQETKLESWEWGYVWVLAGQIYRFPISSYLFAKPGDFISRYSPISRIHWFSSNSCFLGINNFKNLEERFQSNVLKISALKSESDFSLKKITNFSGYAQKTTSLDVTFKNKKALSEAKKMTNQLFFRNHTSSFKNNLAQENNIFKKTRNEETSNLSLPKFKLAQTISINRNNWPKKRNLSGLESFERPKSTNKSLTGVISCYAQKSMNQNFFSREIKKIGLFPAKNSGFSTLSFWKNQKNLNSSTFKEKSQKKQKPYKTKITNNKDKKFTSSNFQISCYAQKSVETKLNLLLKKSLLNFDLRQIQYKKMGYFLFFKNDFKRSYKKKSPAFFNNKTTLSPFAENDHYFSLPFLSSLSLQRHSNESKDSFFIPTSIEKQFVLDNSSEQTMPVSTSNWVPNNNLLMLYFPWKYQITAAGFFCFFLKNTVNKSYLFKNYLIKKRYGLKYKSISDKTSHKLKTNPCQPIVLFKNKHEKLEWRNTYRINLSKNDTDYSRRIWYLPEPAYRFKHLEFINIFSFKSSNLISEAGKNLNLPRACSAFQGGVAPHKKHGLATHGLQPIVSDYPKMVSKKEQFKKSGGTLKNFKLDFFKSFSYSESIQTYLNKHHSFFQKSELHSFQSTFIKVNRQGLLRMSVSSSLPVQKQGFIQILKPPSKKLSKKEKPEFLMTNRLNKRYSFLLQSKILAYLKKKRKKQINRSSIFKSSTFLKFCFKPELETSFLTKNKKNHPHFHFGCFTRHKNDIEKNQTKKNFLNAFFLVSKFDLNQTKLHLLNLKSQHSKNVKAVGLPFLVPFTPSLKGFLPMRSKAMLRKPQRGSTACVASDHAQQGHASYAEQPLAEGEGVKAPPYPRAKQPFGVGVWNGLLRAPRGERSNRGGLRSRGSEAKGKKPMNEFRKKYCKNQKQPKILLTKGNLTNAIKNSEYKIRMKQGWVYFPINESKLPFLHKQWIRAGEPIVDYLVFDKHITYVETLECNHLFNIKNCFSNLTSNFFPIRANNALFSNIDFLNQTSKQPYEKFKNNWFSGIKCGLEMAKPHLDSKSGIQKLNWIKNPKSRYTLHSFFQKSFISLSSRYNSKLHNVNLVNSPRFMILVRKVNDYYLPKMDKFKNQIYQSQNSENVISHLTSKNYKSLILNKRQKTEKFLEKFPNVDLKIECVLDKPKKKRSFSETVQSKIGFQHFRLNTNHSLSKERESSSLVRKPFSENGFSQTLHSFGPLLPFPLSHEERDRRGLMKHERQNNLETTGSKFKFLRRACVASPSELKCPNKSKEKQIYYSLKRINLFPCEIRFLTSSHFSFPFKIPYYRLSSLGNLDLYLEQKMSKDSKKLIYKERILLWSYLLFRNDCVKFMKKPSQVNSGFHFLKSFNQKTPNFTLLKSLPNLLSLPSFSVGIYTKINNLLNWRIAASYYSRINQKNLFMKTYSSSFWKSLFSKLENRDSKFLVSQSSDLKNKKNKRNFFGLSQFFMKYKKSKDGTKFSPNLMRSKESLNSMNFKFPCYAPVFPASPVYPFIKNQLFLNPKNQISTVSPFASTQFFSPYKGEILTLSGKACNSFKFLTEQNLVRSNENENSLPVLFSDSLSRQKQDVILSQVYKTNSLKKERGVDKLALSQNKSSTPKNQLILTSKDLISFSFAVKNFEEIYDLENIKLNTFQKNQNRESEKIIRFGKKTFKVEGLYLGFHNRNRRSGNRLCLGRFMFYGDSLEKKTAIDQAGLLIHINQSKMTLRKGQPIFVSPKAILHQYHGDFVRKNESVVTLAYQRVKTGDIVQGIPKIEQIFEARTTKRGRLFRDSLPHLLENLFLRYKYKNSQEKAVRQSYSKIRQIIVDGVQRVYRSQGVAIADKHIEVVVKEMTSKVRIVNRGVTAFFPGELVDLYFVEQLNKKFIKKLKYEPVVLGISKASLSADSFLASASFQHTIRVLSRAAIYKKQDFLRGLKENVIVGNLIPAGTGFLTFLDDRIKSKTQS